MPNLPASIRLSLWATRAFATGSSLEDALLLATPDADHVHDLAATVTALTSWRDLGERVVLPALAWPGDVTHLPRGGTDFVGAALEAGECVYVPGVGGALVPDVADYGPEGDRGLGVRWQVHDADPVAPHVLDAWSLREIDRDLKVAMVSAADTLTAGSAGPWASRGLRELAEDRLDTTTWGLPAGLETRAAALIARAGIVAEAVSLGLDAPDDGVVLREVSQRRDALVALRADAERALGRAAAIAALSLAGLRPGRSD